MEESNKSSEEIKKRVDNLQANLHLSISIQKNMVDLLSEVASILSIFKEGREKTHRLATLAIALEILLFYWIFKNYIPGEYHKYILGGWFVLFIKPMINYFWPSNFL